MSARRPRRYLYAETHLTEVILTATENPAALIANAVASSVHRTMTAALEGGTTPAAALCALTVTAEQIPDPGVPRENRAAAPPLYAVRAEVTL